MRHILLTQGKVALVDDGDYQRVSEHRWYAQRVRYGWAGARQVKGRIHLQYLHHFVLGSKARIDHKDRNPLNNQRKNLRPATASQNNGNRPKWGTKSKFKGVTLEGDKWRARIGGDCCRRTVGYFTDEREAAIAYDEAAVKFFGEFALTNRQLGLL